MKSLYLEVLTGLFWSGCLSMGLCPFGLGQELHAMRRAKGVILFGGARAKCGGAGEP